jgi:dephospho-CoA kinase
MTTVVSPHIAFIGRAGAGKTTAAELLVKHFGYERLSFAAPLKVACGTSTNRTLLQDVGTGVRALHEDFWVNLFVATLHAEFPERAVVDDCRFPNEVHRLKVEGFVIVRLWADRGTRVARLRANGKLQDEAQLEHISETELDGIPVKHAITNNGDPGYLLDRITTILNQEQR